jgi:hypothetical protein
MRGDHQSLPYCGAKLRRGAFSFLPSHVDELRTLRALRALPLFERAKFRAATAACLSKQPQAILVVGVALALPPGRALCTIPQSLICFGNMLHFALSD